MSIFYVWVVIVAVQIIVLFFVRRPLKKGLLLNQPRPTRNFPERYYRIWNVIGGGFFVSWFLLPLLIDKVFLLLQGYFIIPPDALSSHLGFSYLLYFSSSSLLYQAVNRSLGQDYRDFHAGWNFAKNKKMGITGLYSGYKTQASYDAAIKRTRNAFEEITTKYDLKQIFLKEWNDALLMSIIGWLVVGFSAIYLF